MHNFQDHITEQDRDTAAADKMADYESEDAETFPVADIFPDE